MRLSSIPAATSRLAGGLLAAVLVAGVAAPVSSNAAAQQSAIVVEIAVRDQLVAAQESLLNTYRCLYDIDTQAVRGGCVSGQPAYGPVLPGVFQGVPNAQEVAIRDQLVAAQESLLNTYRCRFDVDTQLVPRGCVGGKPAVVSEEPAFKPDAESCAGVRLVSTDIGVAEDTITVMVMADVGSPLAPGLFQGSIDAVTAWAAELNSDGGLACRRIEVVEHDSQINPTETTNGFLAACEDALALVGTTALFAIDNSDLQYCPDARGNRIGVPDFAYTTTEPPHQCSKVTFAASRPGANCPYPSTGARTVQSQVGPVQWILENVEPNLHGVYLIPSDLPSTIASTMPNIRALQGIGVVIDAERGVSGFTTQSEYGAYVWYMQDANSNFAYTGSDEQSMIKWRNEAEALGLNSDDVTWMCSQACYNARLLEAGVVVEDTYVWLPYLPFGEGDFNQELADFIEAIDTPFPEVWAAGSWAAGVLFEQIVNDIVAEGGLNSVTRQAVLDRARSLESFDVNGWWSSADYTATVNAMPCFVLLQVQDGAFARVYPEEKGTLDCNPDNVVALKRDWYAEFKG